MRGHLFSFDRIPSSIHSQRRLKINSHQYEAGAKDIKKDDYIFLILNGRNNSMSLRLIAKANTRVVTPANGERYIGLKYLKPKDAKNSYKLCDGITTGESLRKTNWKLLDEEEVAACFVNTSVFEAQAKKLQKAIEKAVPKGLGVSLEDIHKSILWNADSINAHPALRKWYDAEILLNEGRYRDALKRRLSEMNGYDFEKLMGAFFRIEAFGYSNVKVTQRAKDGGIDLNLTRQDVLGSMEIVGQCKCTQATIGDAPVKLLKGDMEHRKAAQAIFITTSHFSPQAKEYVKGDCRIRLIDGETLSTLFLHHAQQTPELWKIIAKTDQSKLRI